MAEQDTRGRWRHGDTAVVLLAFLLPLLSTVLAFAMFREWSWGRWNTIEVDWVGWACIGLVLALYKVGLLAGDVEAAMRQGRGWRYVVGGWWTLGNSIGFALAFAAWLIVGVIAGQMPTTEIQTGSGDIPTSFITGGLFMLVEAVFIGVMTFGLICRIRLAE